MEGIASSTSPCSYVLSIESTRCWMFASSALLWISACIDCAISAFDRPGCVDERRTDERRRPPSDGARTTAADERRRRSSSTVIVGASSASSRSPAAASSPASSSASSWSASAS